jgi:alpha-beta hydrolase superfamily lysophospholipase
MMPAMSTTSPADTIVLIHGLWMTPLSWEHWIARYAFGNTLSEPESNAAYERYAVPGPGRPLFQAGLANFNPKAASKVNFGNDTRAPLLIVGGSVDHVVPAKTTRTNFKLYHKSKAISEYKEFPGRSHFTVGQDGWEEVADYALNWVTNHSATYASA